MDDLERQLQALGQHREEAVAATSADVGDATLGWDPKAPVKLDDRRPATLRRLVIAAAAALLIVGGLGAWLLTETGSSDEVTADGGPTDTAVPTTTGPTATASPTTAPGATSPEVTAGAVPNTGAGGPTLPPPPPELPALGASELGASFRVIATASSDLEIGSMSIIYGQSGLERIAESFREVDVPDVDFQEEFVFSMTVRGSGCEPILTGFEIVDERTVSPVFGGGARTCLLPLVAWTILVAVERDSAGWRFDVINPRARQGEQGERRLRVVIDPASPSTTPVPESERLITLVSGDVLTLGTGTHCGVEYLGQAINGTFWRAVEAVDGEYFEPAVWRDLLGGILVVELTLSPDGTRLTATAAGASVVYRPVESTDPEQLCA